MCLHSGHALALLASGGFNLRLPLLGVIPVLSSSERVNVAETAVLVRRGRVGLHMQ